MKNGLNMPTPEEIKKIAHKYGVLMAKDIPESNCLKNEVISSTEYYIGQFISWLSRDYCIVPKSKARELHQIVTDNVDSLDHGLIDGLYDWIEINLDSSLFEEEK